MRNFSLKLLLTFFVLCLLPIRMSQAETVQLTLEDCIQIALKNNPQIEIARQQFQANQGVLTQVKSFYWPQLSGGIGYGRQYIDNQFPVDEDNVGSGLLQASQLIFDFGKTTGLIDASSFNLQASAENLAQVYHDLVFDVKSSFYAVLENKRLIKVAQQAVSNYEQQLYRAQRFFESGVRTRIDVTNAEVNLSNEKLNLLRANSDYKSALVSLEQVIGTVPNNGDYEPVADEPPTEELASQKPEMPKSLETLLQSAEANRPGLKQFQFLIEAAEASITQAKGGYWPTIDAVGGYNTFETDLPSLSDQWQITARLNWEFFSGFETEGKVAEASAQLREVQAGLRDFELEVTRDVTDSYLRADENREGVDIADQTVELAEENLRLAEGRYKAGIGDLLEFNDAQLLYTQNQSNLVITYYNYLTALARIDRAVGVTPELVDYDMTAVPEQQ
ncbi:MAG: TolC family protein [Desulfofustis sp.]|nr:TolC family protein [Desulfofustis sp.]